MKWLFWPLVVIAVFYGYVHIQNPETDGYSHPDLGLKIEDLVRKHRYPFEKHQVVTEDGYILELHRIPHNGDASERSERPSVFLMHGLVANSLAYISGGPGYSLAFFLVDNGYDVWMGNARGNQYSRKHRSVNPDQNPKEFFDYSWNEIGVYDLPASIDYVLGVTGQKQLSYVGHSQGCISFFVMLSERPEYNVKVKKMVALAPVVYTKGIKSLAFNIPAKLQSIYEWARESLGLYEIGTRSLFGTKFINAFCHEFSYLQTLCTIPFGLSGGFNFALLNRTNLPVLLSHVPTGSSMKQLLHYTQILNSDIFRKYDFGEKENVIRYNQNTPPLYDFKNIKTAVAIFYGNNDWLTSKRNIELLQKRLPNVVLKHKVEHEGFNHYDFLTCIGVIDLLYKHVIKYL